MKNMLIFIFFNQIGTGCFILYNTGQDLAYSRNGLLTTVAYKWNDDDPVYALEVRKWWCLEKIYQISLKKSRYDVYMNIIFLH